MSYSNYNEATIALPKLASPKIDGIRAIVKNGIFRSKSMKPLPNERLQRLCSPALEGFDGELYIGNPWAPDVFNRTVSCLMSKNKAITGIHYKVFDYWNQPTMQFIDRYYKLLTQPPSTFHSFTHQQPINSLADIEQWIQVWTQSGYEGLVLKDPKGLYKYGRSTDKEQLAVKYKEHTYSEAIIVGFIEGTTNNNEAVIDNRGLTTRSRRSSNIIPTNTLGSLIVRDLKSGIVFNISSGLTDKEKSSFWENKAQIYHKRITYKSMGCGVKCKPRQPVFLRLA